MTRLGWRIEPLEEKLGVNRLRRVVHITNLLEGGGGEETPWAVKVSSELWAYAAGAPFTKEEILRLAEEYGKEQDRKQSETEKEGDHDAQS